MTSAPPLGVEMCKLRRRATGEKLKGCCGLGFARPANAASSEGKSFAPAGSPSNALIVGHQMAFDSLFSPLVMPIWLACWRAICGRSASPPSAAPSAKSSPRPQPLPFALPPAPVTLGPVRRPTCGGGGGGHLGSVNSKIRLGLGRGRGAHSAPPGTKRLHLPQRARKELGASGRGARLSSGPRAESTAASGLLRARRAWAVSRPPPPPARSRPFLFKTHDAPTQWRFQVC